MIVSKNSWHYKLNCNWGSSNTRHTLNLGNNMSLCKYFWETVKSILGLLVALVISVISVIAVAYVALAPMILLFSSFTGIWWNILTYYDLGMTVILAAPLLLLVAGIVSTVFGDMKVFPKWFPVDKWVGKAVNKSLEHSPKKVNILVEWVKAKKAKVCPIIEFKGE